MLAPSRRVPIENPWSISADCLTFFYLRVSFKLLRTPLTATLRLLTDIVDAVMSELDARTHFSWKYKPCLLRFIAKETSKGWWKLASFNRNSHLQLDWCSVAMVPHHLLTATPWAPVWVLSNLVAWLQGHCRAVRRGRRKGSPRGSQRTNPRCVGPRWSPLRTALHSRDLREPWRNDCQGKRSSRYHRFRFDLDQHYKRNPATFYILFQNPC